MVVIEAERVRCEWSVGNFLRRAVESVVTRNSDIPIGQ